MVWFGTTPPVTNRFNILFGQIEAVAGARLIFAGVGFTVIKMESLFTQTGVVVISVAVTI